MAKHTKPQGQRTRGKTALNRLRQVDNYIRLAWAHPLSVGVPLAVDIGYGEYVWTALEMHQRLLQINPRLRLLGIEIDQTRVMNALPHANPPQIDFRLGGFNVGDIIKHEPATLIRAYNVLRQYDELVSAFFRIWERGLSLARGAGMYQNRRRWVYAVRHLHECGYAIDTRRRIMGRGFLALNHPLLG